MAITTTTGTTYINGDTVTAANLNAVVNNMTISQATGKLIGRTTAGAGTIEEITPDGNFTLSGGGLSQFGIAYASANTTQTSAGYIDCTGLSITLASSTKYNFRAFIIGSGASSAGGAIQMSGTVVPNVISVDAVSWNGTAYGGLTAAASALDFPIISVGTSITYWTVELNGYIQTITGGTLTIQVARSGAGGTSEVKLGSSFRAWKVT